AEPAPAVAKAEVKPAPAPRKIGKAAVEEARVVTAVDPSLGTSAPVAVVPEPVGEPAPKPDLKPEPPAEPARVPAAGPKCAADPVKLEPPKPKPTIDNATVTSVVASHRPEVIKCFADGKKRDRSLNGTVTLQLAVDASGKVARVQIQSTLTSPL